MFLFYLILNITQRVEGFDVQSEIWRCRIIKRLLLEAVRNFV